MYLLKFSLIFALLTGAAWGQSMFSDDECIKSQYQASVSHKGAPFGLFDTILSIDKKDCVITIEHKKMKMMKKRWLVDVCREPVHIKYGTGAVEVFKKEAVCGKAKSDFCENLEELLKVVQDDGLIFANGEKEDISSDHGRIYCSYLLLKTYLQREVILSRFKKYDNFLQVEKKAAPVLKKEEIKLETETGKF